MGRVTVDIKEWVANGRFEGDKKIHNREGTSTINKSIRAIYWYSSVY